MSNPRQVGRFYANARRLYRYWGSTQRLADYLGCTRQHVSNIMTRNRVRAMPSLLVAVRIAEYFGYELHELMLPLPEFNLLIKKKRPTPPKRKIIPSKLDESQRIGETKRVRRPRKKRRRRKRVAK